MSNESGGGAGPSAGATDRSEQTFLGSSLRVLGGVAALGAFGLWVWFVIANFGRLWERVSSFGPGPGRASKLEVAWALLGWAMGPVFAVAIFACLAAGADGIAARWRHREPGSRGSAES